MSPSNPDPAFDTLFQACLDAFEREGPAALEAACAAHPEWAERLRRRMRLLVSADLLDAGPSLDRLPSKLGDFELLDRIGSGGMGVVHRARQSSTGRLVALKLVRPEQLLFASSEARFRREVQLSARLHHPAVLDVVAFGETDGLPWFAMELVHGTSLAALLADLRTRRVGSSEPDPGLLPERVLALTPEALRDGSSFRAPSSWRSWALRTAREVASALAYAHKKGVLHRDVKPSNVLIAGDGRVFLTDFGLAADPDEPSLTRTSSAVGSLPYMAPEVLGGASADAQSDVYGVGVLLYELCALHRPFEAESAAALVSAILTAEPTPLRRHASYLGPDEEAVVLRALERDPRRRYANADELVEDLDHLLARRPTRARPLGALARLARGVRRRPAASAALILGLVALVAGPIGWEVSRQRALRQIRRAYDSELAARERAERHFRTALAAIGHVLRDTASQELQDVPLLQRARLLAIERALELMRELVQDRPEDAAVRLEQAKLYQARADVLYDQGRFDEGLVDCAEAQRLLEALSAPDALASSTTYQEILHLHGKLLQGEQRWLESEPYFERLIEIARHALDAPGPLEDPGPSERSRRLAMILSDFADSHYRTAGPEAASAAVSEGLALARGLAETEPESADMFRTRGHIALLASEIDLELQHPAQALDLVLEAEVAFQRVAELQPSSRETRASVASAIAQEAKVHVFLGQLDQAEERYGRAIELYRALAGQYPEATRYRLEQARAEDEQASAVRYADPERARALHDEALALYEELLSEQPDRCQLRMAAAVANNNSANTWLNGLHRPVDALRDCERGLAILEPCRGKVEDEIAPMEVDSRLHYLKALALCQSDQLEQARTVIEAYEGMLVEDASRWRRSADLWNEYRLGLRRTFGTERVPEALEELARERMYTQLERAIELGYHDLDELQSTPALDSFRGEPELQHLLGRAAGE